ncbi:MAG: putative DNA-binding domain-containing protein [Henriciella sp.]|nr:putative DNA-binding domain-containing protein [Henriciella sp.]
MSPLEAHMDAVIGLIEGRSGTPALTPLLAGGVDAGPRALVYRNSSLLAASDALKSNYQATAAVMGDAFFAAMARAYVSDNRAVSRSLVGYGENLPAFIAAGVSEHGLPWLADLARLDRAWLAAHLAPDEVPFPADAFAELASDQDALFEMRLTVGANVGVIRTGWKLYDLWAGLRLGNLPDGQVEVAQETDCVLITRPFSEVFSRVLSIGEFAFLRGLKAGATLGAAAKIALGQAEDFDIGQAMAGSITDGLFISQQSED